MCLLIIIILLQIVDVLEFMPSHVAVALLFPSLLSLIMLSANINQLRFFKYKFFGIWKLSSIFISFIIFFKILFHQSFIFFFTSNYLLASLAKNEVIFSKIFLGWCDNI